MEIADSEKFIVLTSRTGGRGIDFRGKDNAYVIINLEELTLSEAQQCLGRGARNIEGDSTFGALI